MRKTIASRMLMGLLFILLGVAVIGHVLGIWDASYLARGWWTLFIIVPGVASIINSGFHFWNTFLVMLGVWLFGSTAGWFGYNSFLWFLGALLIAYGIWVLTGSAFSHRTQDASAFENRSFNTDDDDYPEYSCVFSDMNVVNRCKLFRGGKISAVFGKLVIDLREIQVVGHAVLDVAGVFGTVEIILPQGLPVRFSVVPVFGSFQNRRPVNEPPAAGSSYLEVKGASVFGNVNIL